MTASTGGRDPEDQIDATKFGKITHHRVGKFFSFSVRTLLVWRQEGIRPVKKTGCWFVDGDDLTEVLHAL